MAPLSLRSSHGWPASLASAAARGCAIGALAVLGLLASQRPAYAWGIAPPVGPTGAAQACDEGSESTPRDFRLGLTYSATRSVLLLSDGTEACLRRRAATVVGGYRLSPEWSIQVGGGATLGGDATVDETGVIHDLAIGGVGFGGVSYQVLNGVDDLPFVSMGGTLSVSSGGAGRRVGADADDFLTAIDGRFSITAGKVLWSSVAPYAVFRAYGGPVIWVRDGEELAGTDKYHVQLGAGLLVAAGPLDAFFEVVPLGEQALTMGAALRL